MIFFTSVIQHNQPSEQYKLINSFSLHILINTMKLQIDKAAKLTNLQKQFETQGTEIKQDKWKNKLTNKVININQKPISLVSLRNEQ